jgi:hypothetical protein
MRTYLILFLPFLTSFLHAQNTDGVAYTAHAGITFTQGNSNTDQINVGFTAEKVTETLDFSLVSYYDYGQTEKDRDGEKVEVTNLDKGKLEAKGKAVLSEDNFAYVAISIERDEISGIDRRLAAGPGLGHFFRRDEIMTLSVEGGLVWVFEKVDNSSDDYLGARLAQNLKWVLSEGANLRQEVEWIMDTEDEERYFVNASVIAEASLTATLGLRAEIRNTYNNQPGQGKEQNDITVRSGITVSW